MKQKFLPVIAFLILGIFLGINSLLPSAFAATNPPAGNTPAPTLNPSDLFHAFQYPEQPGSTSKIGYVETLSQQTTGTWQDLLAGVIKIILGITGAIAFISFTVSGIMFVTAEGNEEQLGKTRKMIYWSILALVIIAASYALVLGVSKLQF